MKKAITGILCGAVLGALLISFFIFLLNSQVIGSIGRGNESEQTESESKTDTGVSESETVTESETDTETEPPEETETERQTETEDTTEGETQTGTDEPDEPSEPEKPKEVPYYIKVNRAANCVTIYTKDENGNYTVPYKSMICSVGLNNRTPLGKYVMPGIRYKWRKLFGNGVDVYGYYTTRIIGHILFHSVPYTATSNDVLWENQYNMLGSPASKGCIRLAVKDAKWIYDNCGAGTVVEIYDDASNPGPLGRPEAIKITEGSPYAGWDPTDPDLDNPWNKGNVLLNGVQNPDDIERGSAVDLNDYLLGNVTAVDVDGMPLSVTVTTELDKNKVGTYSIVYSATGVTGKTASATASVKVVDTTAPVIKQNQTITVTDNSTDIEQIILDGLELMDNGERIDASAIQLDLSKLAEARKQQLYGLVRCKANASDAYGNTSKNYEILVFYQYEKDKTAPVIEVTGEKVSAYADLTGITDETARKQAVTDAAIAAVIGDKHYTVTDNVSDAKEIVCAVTGIYEGETVPGVHSVDLTITATDEAGNSSTATIVAEVTIAENITTEQN